MFIKLTTCSGETEIYVNFDKVFSMFRDKQDRTVIYFEGNGGVSEVDESPAQILALLNPDRDAPL